MQRKRYENILFLGVVVLLIAYTFFLGVRIVPQATGMVAYETKEQITSIYDFLSLAKNYPDSYILVLGSYAKEYEIRYGDKIAESFGLKLRYEEDVESRKNLILIGTPNTNFLLDKFLTKPYSKDEALITLNGGNLLFIISDEDQAEDVADLIMGFRENRDKLSPSTVVLGFGEIAVYLVVLFVFIIISVILFVESYRKKAIDHAHEVGDEPKLEALEKYIKKYEDDGHSADKIEEWLVDYGYEEELVQKAIEGVKNARTDISA